jgi:hypothetical protein
MREFSFRLEEELEGGLRADSRNKLNHVGLVECMGLKPVKGLGLVPYKPITLKPSSATLTAAGITPTFPFPQLFRGKDITLLCDETKIYEVDESDWSISQITTYDAYDVGSTKSIVAGGVWHLSDFGDSWFLFNGSCMVYKTNRYGIVGGTNKVLVQTTMSVKTGCAHRGRSIMAGFSSDFWTDDWETYWTTARSDIPQRITDNLALDTNYVLWSSIGGGDTLCWLFEDYAMEGPLAQDSSYIISMLKRNEWGFMPMPWQGTIHCVKSLGKNVAVYGSGGIDVLVQTDAPFPTFGLQHISGVHIADRGAVGGDENVHVFMDDSGTMWRLGADLGLARLGYEEFFSSMPGDDIIVTYNIQENEFVVSDDSEAYILTSAGLGEANQLIMSQEYYDGEIVGIYDASITDAEGRFRTDTFDMGLRTIKQITAIEVGFEGDTTLSVGVYTRFNKAGSFIFSGYKVANKEGIVYPLVSGVDFQLRLKGTDYSKTRITYIVVRYKVSDKRSIRGLYASKNAS